MAVLIYRITETFIARFLCLGLVFVLARRTIYVEKYFLLVLHYDCNPFVMKFATVWLVNILTSIYGNLGS